MVHHWRILDTSLACRIRGAKGVQMDFASLNPAEDLVVVRFFDEDYFIHRLKRYRRGGDLGLWP